MVKLPKGIRIFKAAGAKKVSTQESGICSQMTCYDQIFTFLIARHISNTHLLIRIVVNSLSLSVSVCVRARFVVVLFSMQ